MAERSSRQRQASILRVFRKIHRWTGAFLFTVFFAIAITGLGLGWKKHSGDLILPETRMGSSTDLNRWKPIAELYQVAVAHYRDSVYPGADFQVERIDVRPEKGLVKVVFDPGFIGIQVDGATGSILHVGRRNSDLLEKLHDGSMVDRWLGLGSGAFKLIYTSVSGLALLLFTITGFWLWYGPKRMRRKARS
jgi:uncharacterized iron-regulated membrane protein